MVLSPEARVGTIAIVGILMIVMVVIFLGGMHIGPKGYTVRVLFEDAQGLENGSAVRMSGVKVGEVTDMELTDQNKALVTVRLHRSVRLWDSSKVLIDKGSLLGERFILIKSVREGRGGLVRNNAVLQGTLKPQLEDLIPQAYDVLVEVKGLSSNISKVTGDEQVMIALKEAVLNISKTAAAVSEIAADPRMMNAMRASVANVQMATANGVKASAHGVKAALNVATMTKHLDGVARILNNIESITSDNKDEINGMLANLETTSKNIQAVSETVKWLMDDSGTKQNVQQAVQSLTDAAKNLQDTTAEVRKLATDQTIQSDLKESLTTLKKTMENLEGTTSSFKQLISDQQLQTDLKDTVHTAKTTMDSARVTMENAKTVSAKVGVVVDKVTKPVGTLLNLDVGTEFNSRYFPTSDRIFTDFSLRLTQARKNLLALGMYGIGEGDKLILQGGVLRDPWTLRFGVYRSAIGVGADYRVGSAGQLSVEAFDPNDRQVSLWGKWPLSDRLKLMLGVEDVTDRRLGGFGFSFGK